MEELRSTEILDKEIEADARKKAEKIQKNAEAECARILSSVDGRIKDAGETLASQYKSRIEKYEQNAKSALPLEEARFLVQFYADSVIGAFGEYLKNLGKEKRLSLIEKKCKKVVLLLSEKSKNAKLKFRAKSFGLSDSEVRTVLDFPEISLISVEETTFEKSGEEAVRGNNIHEGIILESEDGTVRIRLTIEQILREIMDEYSEELATHLFGGTLPQ